MNQLIPPATRLDRWGTLLVSGVDARAFLQGQLTADLDQLTPSHVLLACCNSPQGRVQAVLWLVDRPEGILLLVSATMVEVTLTRLRKYILRAKVKIDHGAGTFAVGARAAENDITATTLRQQLDGDTSHITWPGLNRTLLIAPSSTMDSDPSLESKWHLEDIRAGLPQVYPQTHEAFVAQMLNLDLLGGISFEKGCYTGQEIIARTHYRGAIKRRMHRFAAAGAPPLPGTRLVVAGTHAGDVVDAEATENGCELLAVVNETQLDAELTLDGDSTALKRLMTG
jgi:folate-binding protein YgfZ